VTSPYLNSREAAAYVRKSLKGFDHWVATRGVPYVRAGRIRLFTRDTLDRVLKNDARPQLRRVSA
jgi:hypothetical protein